MDMKSFFSSLASTANASGASSSSSAAATTTTSSASVAKAIAELQSRILPPRFIGKLPIKEYTSTVLMRRPQSVPDAIYAYTKPTLLQNPRLISYSPSVLEKLLHLPQSAIQSKEALASLTNGAMSFAKHDDEISKKLDHLIQLTSPASSNESNNDGALAFSHVYCGHQFGSFAGQLGDGTNFLIGEIKNNDDKYYELQLKGGGMTPFSRQADGRKVLRSSLREYLCSEMMHGLHVPTTRAGALITSDSKVIRDILYDGHPEFEPCAIVMRVAETFLRFGSFEIGRHVDQRTGQVGPSFRNKQIVKDLCRYTVQTYYPELIQNRLPENVINNQTVTDEWKPVFVDWYKEIVKRTASLAAKWQCVGWVHGVLNTDNMGITGLTIDYGPYAFMETYEPTFTSNTSDSEGRYAYFRQPLMCKWNCYKLGEALLNQDVLDTDPVQEILDMFDDYYESSYLEGMRNKLGLSSLSQTSAGASSASASPSDINKSDMRLIKDMFNIMSQTGTDFTLFFRKLTLISSSSFDSLSDEELLHKFFAQDNFVFAPANVTAQMVRSSIPPGYLEMLSNLVKENQLEQLKMMGLTPEIVKSEIEKTKLSDELLQIHLKSKDEQIKRIVSLWTPWIRSWRERRRLETNENRTNHLRIKMLEANPEFVLRNHVAQRAITFATNEDFSETNKLLQFCLNPFTQSLDDIDNGKADAYYAKKYQANDSFRYDLPVYNGKGCALSCSS